MLQMKKHKTVRELILELEQYKDDALVIFRRGYGNGYFSDHNLSGPHDFYPHEAAYFSTGDQIMGHDECKIEEK